MKNLFDPSFNPPAPIGSVLIRDIATGKRSAGMQVMLDTGSDITLLPSTVVDDMDLGNFLRGDLELEGFDGSTSVYRAVSAQIIFLGKRISGTFGLIDNQVGILGRDVLNHFALLLDGPSLTWDKVDQSDDFEKFS